MTEVLDETYGIMAYQEQVMRICNRLGDIPLRDAYKLIKAISKKKAASSQKEKERFLAGCVSQGSEEGGGGADLRADRAVRRLRLQQEPLDRLRVRRLPDGLPEGPLPRRVHGRPADLRNGRHGQDRRVHRRVPGDGRRGDGPGHQRQRRRFHAAVQGDRPRGQRRDPLRTGGGQGRGRKGGRAHHRGPPDASGGSRASSTSARAWTCGRRTSR